jgi:tetratricopeptide (TPR) repeat protein
VNEQEAGRSFTRKDVCRLLKMDGRQLRIWERQQLIPAAEEYRFSDLLALKTIARLRAEQVPPRMIRQALASLRDYLRAAPNIAGDVRVFKEGRKVQIQIGRQKLDPISGQLIFDFDEHEISKLLHLPSTQKSAEKLADRVRRKIEADRWFEQGLELERRGAPLQEIIEAYSKAAELDPQSAGALVNLGTVFFNGHAWADAEEQYRRALEIDPHYALAHFNLGNLYDEQGDCPGALEHYREALRLQPRYADAHYNLALLCQSQRDVMGAVGHWRAYLKLDSTSQWAEIARRELKKLEAVTVVQGNRSSANLVEMTRSGGDPV